jgi:GAF domain-containing protein
MHTPSDKPADSRGAIDYAALGEQWRAMAEGEEDPMARMATLAALVYHADARFSWVGFYRVLPNGAMVIGPYQGPPGCLRIANGRGVCGAAAATGTAVRVDDVREFPGHIACDPRSRSELVVPVRGANGAVLAVMDLDSHEPAAFTPEDERGLAGLLADLLAS